MTQPKDRAIAEVILDQLVLCGVGNVYRSEVLWACEMHPFAPVSALEGDECAQLVHTAARMLRANLTGPGRVTNPDVRGGLGHSGDPAAASVTRRMAIAAMPISPTPVK